MMGPALEWSQEKLRRKLLPLLLAWDAAHPGHVRPCTDAVAIPLHRTALAPA